MQRVSPFWFFRSIVGRDFVREAHANKRIPMQALPPADFLPQLRPSTTNKEKLTSLR